ncbi:MAG: cysteine--tRNA ligase [Candidatus Absconditabacterales bacterium]
MKLKIYNTLTRQKEEFIPLMEDPNYKGPKKDFVGIYSCGPTVYSLPHFGNLRAAFTADLIRNVIKNILGYKTKFVMNITDVGHMVGDGDHGEDKMEKGARLEGASVRDVAKKYENIFRVFFKGLNIDDFDYMPRATESIKDQIKFIQIIESKGYTYIVPEDGIYIDTSKISDYGKLLGPNYKKALEGIQAGERIDMGGKKNSTDFALRKFSPKDQKRQMERDSPRGIGFPGWHSECCVMSSNYLGHQFDIHHGGVDLLPIHHTNEIVQSEIVFDVNPRVKYRIHHQFVNMNGKKMSKSDGNNADPSEVLEKGYDYLDIRYWFLTAQYNSFLDFTRKGIGQIKNARENLIRKLKMNNEKLKIKKLDLFVNISYLDLETLLQTRDSKNFFNEIVQAICDDFNTPKLLSIINTGLANANGEIMQIIYRLEKKLLKIGLFDFEEIQEKNKNLENIPQEISDLVEQRLIAKKNKNFQLSDELRNEIKNLGREIKDTKDGYEVTKLSNH